MKILDTNVLIDLDRHPENFEAGIEQLALDDILYISSVTVYELWWGAYYSYLKKKKNDNLRNEFDEFISAFVIIDVDHEIGIVASTVSVDLQLIGNTIDLHDLYIAATAKVLNVPLITNNVKHFENIQGLKLIKWPELSEVGKEN